MNKYINIVLFIIFLPFLSFAQLNQELINYTQSIHKDSLQHNVQTLQNFGSRYAFNPNRVEIAQYLKNRFEQYGLETKIDSFYIENFEYPYYSGIINNGWQYNVVAEKRGQYAPDTFFVVGAHYDSFASFDTLTYFNNSPGADDNASSVATVLEIARLFHKHNISPIKTLRLELYAAEELGLKGSSVAIERSHYRFNEHISAMMNLDMIGYKSDLTTVDYVKLIKYDNSQELTDFCETTTNNYTTLIPMETTQMNQYSDSYAYYIWGRRAIFIQEGEFHPFYHTSQDLASTLDYNYLAKIAQLAFSIAYLASTTNEYYPVSNINIKPLESQFQILENPSKEKIRFAYQNQDKDKANLILTNSLGIQVLKTNLLNYKIENSTYEISTHNLQSGIYILTIETQPQKTSKKLIVIK